MTPFSRSILEIYYSSPLTAYMAVLKNIIEKTRAFAGLFILVRPAMELWICMC